VKVLDYKNWKKRNLLVLKMLTTSDLLENSLSLLGLPHIVYDCTQEENFEERWKADKDNVCGVIISGSRTIPEYRLMPAFPEMIIYETPVLGICYGHEILGAILGSEIVNCNGYGEHTTVRAKLYPDPLFESIDTSVEWVVSMRHDQMLSDLPNNSKLLASTTMTPVAGFYNEEHRWWGIQFHPERDWFGNIIFKNFYKICRS
jgi:GMP synthase-like glutamine amidotransferase